MEDAVTEGALGHVGDVHTLRPGSVEPIDASALSYEDLCRSGAPSPSLPPHNHFTPPMQLRACVAGT